MKFFINIDCLGLIMWNKQNIFVKINFPEQGGGGVFLTALKIACARSFRRIVKIYFKSLASSTYKLVFMRGVINLYTKYLQQNT